MEVVGVVEGEVVVVGSRRARPKSEPWLRRGCCQLPGDAYVEYVAVAVPDRGLELYRLTRREISEPGRNGDGIRAGR